MKIATHILFFNQDKWILKNIEMIGPYVDKIYIGWSEFPWSYNPNAKGLFKNNSNIDILKQSSFFNKIEVIKGNWNLDEDERNSCLERARNDGMEYLFIIDADEFYNSDDIEKMITEIKNSPDYEYYLTPWITYWKDFNHLIIDSAGDYINGYPEVCINLKYSNKFIRCRKPSGTSIKKLSSVCNHVSYVLTDDECWSKINTWGHAHQFNRNLWFSEKWIKWNESTINLHPITPQAWYKAIKRPEIVKLPLILNDLI